MRLVLVAAALAAGAFAVPASAEPTQLCEISVRDNTPGTYPGGMYVYNSCFHVNVAIPDTIPPR
jgi:hypothetical protein